MGNASTWGIEEKSQDQVNNSVAKALINANFFFFFFFGNEKSEKLKNDLRALV